MKVCLDLSTAEFLHVLQLHTLEYGVSILVLSNLSSQLVAGADIITNFSNDPVVQSYFKENNAKSISFQQYYKGCNKLGSLVESFVKLSKLLLSGSVKKNILPLRQFEFFVAQAVHIANRRPVAFREGLRDCSGIEIPEPNTPELLIHGHKLLSISMISSLQTVTDEDFAHDADFDTVKIVQSSLCKLSEVHFTS